MKTKNKLKDIRYIDVMPVENDYEEFKKYILNFRKETNLKVKWNIEKNLLIIKDSLVYFDDYKSCICYLEGYKKGRLR